MNGKKVEKLMLSYRIGFIAAILAVLVFATVPHPSSNHQDSLDSMLGNTDFNTVDFSSVLNVEVPIAGETTNNETEVASSKTIELDQSIKDLIASTAGVGNLREALLEIRDLHAKEAAEREAKVNQTANSTNSSNYSASRTTRSNANSTNSTTTSNPAPTANQSSTQRKSRGSSIDYNRVVYVDDNGEAIDSSTDDRTPSATPDPNPTPEESSTEE